jgi:hypothetical protein
MEKEKYYDEQAEAFIDYAGKFSDVRPYDLFDGWAKSKDLGGVDREMIWAIVRPRIPKRKKIVIEENSDEWMRISAVLDMVLRWDLMELEMMLEKEENQIDKT